MQVWQDSRLAVHVHTEIYSKVPRKIACFVDGVLKEGEQGQMEEKGGGFGEGHLRAWVAM